MDASSFDEACVKQCLRNNNDKSKCQQQCTTAELMKKAADEGFIRKAAAEGLKDFKIKGEASRLAKDVKDINDRFGRASEQVRAGRAAEVWHRATYNADAIKKGVDTRAVGTSYHAPSDLNVGSSDVQIKYGTAGYLNKLNNSKYDGMQKVVPKGHADAAKGWQDRVSVDGAQSNPLSTVNARSLVNNPERAAQAGIPTESVSQSAYKTGVMSGLSGGAVGGAVAGLAACAGGADAKTAAVGAVQSGLSSGLSSAAADAIVSSTGTAALGAFGGGLVSGAVNTGFSMRQCSRKFEHEADQRNCRADEAKKGTVSTTSAATATLLCSTFMGPFGAVCGMAAGMATRAAFDAGKSK